MFHDKIICQRLSLRVRNRTVTGQLMGRRREMWTVYTGVWFPEVHPPGVPWYPLCPP